jgi:hypothetical protein
MFGSLDGEGLYSGSAPPNVGREFTHGQPSRVLCSVIMRVGQNRIYTPYMTVYLVNSLPKIPYIHRIYMVLANPSHHAH